MVTTMNKTPNEMNRKLVESLDITILISVLCARKFNSELALRRDTVFLLAAGAPQMSR